MIYHVLIVDDEPIVRQGLIQFEWESYGFEAVHACNNGREALQWLNANQVELVVTDIKMPGMDGVELSGKIRELYPDTMVLLLTGYNEFTYAQQAIKNGVFDYLLKPASDDDFEQVLSKAYKHLRDREEKKRMQETMTYHFLLRNQVKDSQFSMETLNLARYPEHAFRLVLAYLPSERMEAEIADRLAQHKFVQLNKREWVMLATEDEMEHISQAFGNSGVELGISSSQPNRNDIPAAYKEAGLALTGKFLCADQHVFHYSDSASEEKQLLFVTDILKKIMNWNTRIQGSTDKQIKHFLSGIVEEIRVKGLAVPYIKQLMVSMVSVLEKELSMVPFFLAEEWDRAKESFLNTVGTAQNLDVIEQNLCNGICEFIEKLYHQNVQAKESAKLQEVLDYIHEHYPEVVSLDVISEVFRMHPANFSKWFKENKGNTFVDYLTKYRMDQAKQLLEQTDLKLTQIAEAVGFQDARYFGQVFKKQVDLTPGEYRILFK
ncbi:hypothetical protein ASG89_00425 [Paenibacillus sp. Soil766]|uniref:response regulator n=1 Tax=Paenibacillus sp. Soil766 TaxID=1736404 RepID=UPI00070FD752|nr:response regulator [Paenibacillus sp. Soil766]KRF10049.1 hypothetical protein ASG89_00425 [Paenibacillus sp. Soil766]